MQTLPLHLKHRYGVADLGFVLLGSAMQFFLLFYYTDVALVDLAVAGTALLVGKLTWDAINDPLFGYISDRTHCNRNPGTTTVKSSPTNWSPKQSATYLACEATPFCAVSSPLRISAAACVRSIIPLAAFLRLSATVRPHTGPPMVYGLSAHKAPTAAA